MHELRIDLPSLEEYFQQITEGQDRAEELAAAKVLGAGDAA